MYVDCAMGKAVELTMSMMAKMAGQRNEVLYKLHKVCFRQHFTAFCND